MKKKELEILLQQIPSITNPSTSLEQYITPASIAADIIFLAHQSNDIQEKIVCDLGCGTGIFSVGAAITGAKKVIGIDIDASSIAIANDFAKKHDLTIEFKTQNITDVHLQCNTVIMNPPFGAQKSNQKADRAFIEKAVEIAEILYSLHLTKTIPFIKILLNSLNAEILYQKEYRFPIKWMFQFHTKEVKTFEVTLLRISAPKK